MTTATHGACALPGCGRPLTGRRKKWCSDACNARAEAAKRREYHREYFRRYYAENRVRIIEKNRRWNEANRERKNELSRQSRARRKREEAAAAVV